MDQATTLRKIIRHRSPGQALRPRPESRPRVISVTSGKGGVGKTNTVLNLALALSARQRKVLLLDADLGLANVDVLLGLTPRYTLEHVLDGRKDIMDVVLEGPQGLKLLPSGSGIGELSELDFEEQQRLFAELRRIGEEADYLFIDTGAGISSNVLRFNASAHEVIVVTNPEPTSLTDAYALMKLLSAKYQVRQFALIANSVASQNEGFQVYQRLHRACTQFLGVRLSLLGAVPFDRHFRKAVQQQNALLECYPHSPAAKALQRVAALIDQGPPPRPIPASSVAQTDPFPPGLPPASPLGFWDRLLHWKKVR